MIGAFLLLLRILFYRPLILMLLLLVYSVAAFLLITVDSPKKGFVVAIMAAFATLGLSAVLTERISRYCRQASEIGLPDHARTMQWVQGCHLVLFVVLPALLSCLFGAAPLVAFALLVTATAAGVVLATYGGVWLVLVPLSGRVLPLEAWAQLASVQALTSSLSVFLIWRWFQLPSRIELVGTRLPVRLADARHEQIDRSQRSHDASTATEGRAMLSADPWLDALAADLRSGRHLPAVLSLGFGYSIRIAWRPLLYSVGIFITAMAAWSVLRGSKPAFFAYGAVTALCCFTLMARVQGVLQRLMRTSTEQALLQLAPTWPNAGRIKVAMIKTVLLVQRASAVVWVASSAVAASLGWIGRAELLLGGVAIVGTSLAFSGSALAILAHRRIKEINPGTVAIVLTVFAGVAAFMFSGGDLDDVMWIVGTALMVIPPGLALAAYCMLPSRFPLSVDPRALKDAL